MEMDKIKRTTLTIKNTWDSKQSEKEKAQMKIEQFLVSASFWFTVQKEKKRYGCSNANMGGNKSLLFQN